MSGKASWRPEPMAGGGAVAAGSEAPWLGPAGVLGAPHSASSDMNLPLSRPEGYGACDVDLQMGDGLGAPGRERKQSSLTKSLALAAGIAESANLIVDQVGLHETKTERRAGEGGMQRGARP